MREDVDDANRYLDTALESQGRVLGGQLDDTALQKKRLQALMESKNDGWKGLSAVASRGSSQIRDIVGAVREKISGLFDGSPAAREGEAALAELSQALEGHNAAQEGLIYTLKDTTSELQVKYCI